MLLAWRENSEWTKIEMKIPENNEESVEGKKLRRLTYNGALNCKIEKRKQHFDKLLI